MPSQADRPPLNVRAVLECTGTPFSVGQYGPRGVIFVQGDACGSVLHIERGRVRLSVTTASGRNAICSLVEAGRDGHDRHAGFKKLGLIKEVEGVLQGNSALLHVVDQLIDVSRAEQNERCLEG